MATQIYFNFHDYWGFYAVFTAFILLMLSLDLGIFERKSHVMPFREAIGWVALWVTLALAFDVGFYFYCSQKFSLMPGVPAGEAHRLAFEFLAGYITEQSLSVDNLFVFIVVFSYFKIAPEHQHRILFFGILGAIIFRGLMIFAGTFLMQYWWVVVAFGVFLILTGLKLVLGKDEETDLEKSPVIRLLKRILPLKTHMSGQSFFVLENGKWFATPLFLCLCAVEVVDVVFALDSIPAVFGLTREPFIVFTSNIFAILGLRSMYFVVSGVITLFRFLKYGLGFVLIFVGVKMSVFEHWGFLHISSLVSLAIICGVLGLSVLLSILIPDKSKVDSASDRH